MNKVEASECNDERRAEEFEKGALVHRPGTGQYYIIGPNSSAINLVDGNYGNYNHRYVRAKRVTITTL